MVSILFLAIASRRVNKTLDESQIPLMATLTAMFFAAQMMNYPIVGGTTAHLLGGPILAITLGPYAALISMTIILLIQLFFFGDGGLFSFGACSQHGNPQHVHPLPSRLCHSKAGAKPY